MLTTTTLDRVFLFKEKERDLTLTDPNPAFMPKEVLNFYSATYATLTTATIEGPEVENDRLVYRFVSTIGTKG
jgi:PRTRC genetic system protein C